MNSVNIDSCALEILQKFISVDCVSSAERLLKFKSAATEDKMGRAKAVAAEIEFVLARG